MRRLLFATLLVALLLVASGLVYGRVNERPLDGSGTFHVSFGERSTRVPFESTSRTGPGTMELEAPVLVTNLTALRFDVDLAWSSPRAAAISLEFSYVWPDGRTTNVSVVSPGVPSTSESTFHEFRFNDVPAPRTIEAKDQAEAERSAAATSSRTEGTGTWRILVTIPPSQYDGPAPPEYTLSVGGTAFSFEAKVVPMAA